MQTTLVIVGERVFLSLNYSTANYRLIIIVFACLQESFAGADVWEAGF